MGPASGPNSHIGPHSLGSGVETQFSWVIHQDSILLSPAKDLKLMGPSFGPRELGPSFGPKRIGSHVRTQGSIDLGF